MNVATVLPALKLTAPATALPPESLTVNDTVFGADRLGERRRRRDRRPGCPSTRWSA